MPENWTTSRESGIRFKYQFEKRVPFYKILTNGRKAMIQNKIVVHHQDGRLTKGITNDFFPDKDLFHLVPVNVAPGSKALELRTTELKAVFFVKEFGGNPDYIDRKEFDPAKSVIGRKIKVVFKDGDLMVGTTLGYQPDRSGFFVVPADSQSNIERCFVVTSATEEVSFI